MGLTVAVVGATGNLGTSTVQALAADDAVDRIVGIARRRPELVVDKTTWVTADISRAPDPSAPRGSDDLVTVLRGADVVVHQAWLIQPQRDEATMHRTNVAGTARLLAAAAEAGVGAVVYSSSVGAYSPGSKTTTVDESYPTHGHPTCAYSRQKAYAERLLDAFEAQHPDIRVVRFRPGFVFKREAAAEIRRLFIGPFVPGALLRPRFLPRLPAPASLCFQAVHSLDVGDAFRRAVVGEASGAFNLAADPVLDSEVLGHVLGAPPVPVPAGALRAGAHAAWRARLVPVEPGMVDLLLGLPIMDTARARDVLGWRPVHDSTAALVELLGGLQDNAGMPTPPLDPGAGGRLRWRELASGVGARP